jgi:hypothetical protein
MDVPSIIELTPEAVLAWGNLGLFCCFCCLVGLDGWMIMAGF